MESIDVSPLISHRFSIESAEEAYHQLLSGTLKTQSGFYWNILNHQISFVKSEYLNHLQNRGFRRTQSGLV